MKINLPQVKSEENKYLLIGLGILLLFWQRNRIIYEIYEIIEQRSMEKSKALAQLHPKVLYQFQAFEKEMNALGYMVDYTSVFRSNKIQDIQNGVNKNYPIGGNSKHNYGMAVDMNLININTGKRLVKKSPLKDWLATGIKEAAKRVALEWGGLYNDIDTVHLESNLYKIADLRAKQLEQQVDGNKLVL